MQAVAKFDTGGCKADRAAT